MMQMPAHQVIYVIAMRYSLVPAAFPMHMAMLMPVAGMRPATAWVRL